ncbi:MAG: DUF2806 domain-containing protein [Pyrinomonadaceae bacterium]
MSDTPSLIDIGKLSEPATKLIEKISDGIGGVCAPWQVRRMARADAEAAIVKAGSDIEVDELKKRALARFIDEEARKQENIEEITAKAIPLLEAGAQPENIDNDWIVNFFDKSRIISDQQMQELWARILAGEANRSGSFSRKTINRMSDIEKADADMFSDLCRFKWSIGKNSRALTLVLDVENEIYKNNEILFGRLGHLETVGLIKFDSHGGFTLQNLGKPVKATYFGKELILDSEIDEENRLPIGEVVLTVAGMELAQVCTAEPVDGFFEYVEAFWKKGSSDSA